jgi:hypothetical protein
MWATYELGYDCPAPPLSLIRKALGSSAWLSKSKETNQTKRSPDEAPGLTYDKAMLRRAM